MPRRPPKPATGDPSQTTLPFVRGSRTSRAAAASWGDTAVSETEHSILKFVAARGPYGVTDDELEIELRLRHQTASARRRGLELKGLLKAAADGQQTVLRPTRSGRRAQVWILASTAYTPNEDR